MAIERKNPLPIGKYWVDIIPTKAAPLAITTFNAWLARNGRAVNVVDRKEESSTDLFNPSGKSHLWCLFSVTAPVKWETNQGWGLPTIAQSPTAPTAAPVASQADTVTRPPPPTASDMFSEWFGDAKGLVGLLVLGYLLSRHQ